MNIISSVPLAGGKSARMGRDKCFIEVDGKSMWQRQLDLLLPLLPKVFVVAPRRPEWLPQTIPGTRNTVQNAGPIRSGLMRSFSVLPFW
jgi:molybdenum cofactor guanylyltransferase